MKGYPKGLLYLMGMRRNMLSKTQTLETKIEGKNKKNSKMKVHPKHKKRNNRVETD